MKSVQRFVPPVQEPGIIHTDGSLGFIRAYEGLCRNHDKSTPYRSETNRIAEHAVRGVEERTSALLVQSGLSEKCWEEAMECFCYLRNIRDKMADRKSPCERRCGTPFDGPHGTASRMDGQRVFQSQRHRRSLFGPQSDFEGRIE